MITNGEIKFERYFMYFFLSYGTLAIFFWGDVGDYLDKVWGFLPALIFFILIGLYSSLTICYRNISQSIFKSLLISYSALILSFTSSICAAQLYDSISKSGEGAFAHLLCSIFYFMYAFAIAIILIMPLCFGIDFVLRKLGERINSKWLME